MPGVHKACDPPKKPAGQSHARWQKKMTMKENSKIWCPRCDQGWVVHAIIRADSTSLWICDECDAIWLSVDTIGQGKWIDFTEYMEERNLPGTWDQLVFKEMKSENP